MSELQRRLADAELARLREINTELRAVLEAFATAFDVPRDRLGRLYGDHSTREPLRLLAVKYNTPGAQDSIEQAMHVARAALAKAKP